MKNLSTLLAVTFTTLLAGCASPAAPRQATIGPMRPAPITGSIDYSQRSLKDIDETQRRELLREQYGDDLSTTTQAVPRPPANFPPEVDPEPVRRVRRNCQTVYPPDTAYCPDPVYPDHRYPTHSYRSYSYPRYSSRHHRYRRHSLDPISGAVIYGTIGGIIGHQSGHRDRGILYGAGFGLLNGLFNR